MLFIQVNSTLKGIRLVYRNLKKYKIISTKPGKKWKMLSSSILHHGEKKYLQDSPNLEQALQGGLDMQEKVRNVGMV